jgi:hypothetical protein
VKEFHILDTTKEINCFLELASYYRRFVLIFSEIAKPLTNLLKKNKPFIWNADTDEAFNTLKLLLTSQPLLHYANVSKPFNLTRVANNDALGLFSVKKK